MEQPRPLAYPPLWAPVPADLKERTSEGSGQGSLLEKGALTLPGREVQQPVAHRALLAYTRLRLEKCRWLQETTGAGVWGFHPSPGLRRLCRQLEGVWLGLPPCPHVGIRSL